MSRTLVTGRRYDPGAYAPDVQQRTTGASIRTQIVFTTVGAFAISYIAKMKRFDKASTAEAAQITAKGAIGWFVLLIALSAMSDFETTSQLAIAFAWVILLASLFVNGPKALKVINTELDKARKQTEPKKT